MFSKDAFLPHLFSMSCSYLGCFRYAPSDTYAPNRAIFCTFSCLSVLFLQLSSLIYILLCNMSMGNPSVLTILQGHLQKIFGDQSWVHSFKQLSHERSLIQSMQYMLFMLTHSLTFMLVILPYRLCVRYAAGFSVGSCWLSSHAWCKLSTPTKERAKFAALVYIQFGP